MADWKQITARIRRAKGSKDPVGQLCNLFQKTRDAMVAFELARHLETVNLLDDAVKWYAISWQRFRRGDWKTKAEEGVSRLGATLPTEGEVLPVPEVPRSAATESSAAEDSSEAVESGGASLDSQASDSSASDPDSSEAAPTSADAAAPKHARRLPVEPAAEISGPGVKGRFGDPGLSSRISLLEMQFRRLLTCAAVKLDQADRAPAGPGVFVLTDDDMTTYYYVEACDTLRIAIANTARGGSNRRTGISIKPLLADHLGIPETRVAKYLGDHCVVRWLQLDEGAEHFAHFVIAILRPILNSQS